MSSVNILLPETINLSLAHFNSSKFLIFKSLSNIRYVSIPTFVFFSKKLNVLKITCDSIESKNIFKFNQFSTCVKLAIKDIDLIFKRKLTLKGLGFRMNIIDDHLIEFKLGLSHPIYVNVPQNISVRVGKSALFLESLDNILLGNFIDKIILLKAPDSYKGKGFWYKYQVKTLKTVKKK